VLVMRTAYLKAHYPYEFMAAVLSSYMGNNDRLTQYVSSCNRSGIPVLPPDINSSNLEFTPTEDGVRFGLAGVRGVGEKVVEAIVAERNANGPYTSLHDFVDRLDAKTYNRKTLEALIKAGAFDSTGYTRRHLMYFLEETTLLESAAKRQRDRMAGQGSIFDMFADEGMDSGMEDEVPEPDGVEWDRRTLLAFEKEILGIYVSDHPLNPYKQALARLAKHTLSELAERGKDVKNGTFAGMISGVSTRMTKRNTKMSSFVLEDTSGHVECVCFNYDDNAQWIQEDAIVSIKGKFEVTDRGNQILAYEVNPIELTDADANRAPDKLQLSIPASEFNQNVSINLSRILKKYPGHDGVELFVTQSDGRRFRAELPMTVDSRSSFLLSDLGSLFGRPVWKSAS
jgi:DNA polymerase-3 subunit alpha